MREFLDFLYKRKFELEGVLKLLGNVDTYPEDNCFKQVQDARVKEKQEALAWTEKAIDLLLLVRGTVL